MITKTASFFFGLALFSYCCAEPTQISGVYPSLNMYNNENECGTGAVVVWQGDLWAITYAPHQPEGSSDKLYQISPDLNQTIFAGSVGGTPANRMIHRESNQLLIGPYLIDKEKNIRVIPPSKMLGRLTGNARHLTSPNNKVYYATMEEGLYEVDVNTLEVTCKILDGHEKKAEGLKSKLPGYHGKGLYSGQGRLIYTNNGEKSKQARQNPTTVSGALAQWFGKGDWQMVRRNQFTEATGPGGIYGNENANSDPIWTMGWDAKSLLLGLLENKKWHFYRLPKGSHSYDGAHGWNTEWPRIREIGETDLLATMHGTFWRFPATFSRTNSAGIRPRSNYLKVIGDFCRWNDRIVLGCDDSAKMEFLNTRSFKAKHGAAIQSNSNLWFIEPDRLDELGPAIGRGSVWLREPAIKKDQKSDPYLFSGYDYRQLYLYHESKDPVTFVISCDKKGDNQWSDIKELVVPPKQGVYHLFDQTETGQWITITARDKSTNVTAHFHYRNKDQRSNENHSMFAGLGSSPDYETNGVMRSLQYNKLGLVTDGLEYYELSQTMQFEKVDNPTAAKKLVADVQQPHSGYSQDTASILIEESGQRYRLPFGSSSATMPKKNRVCREVATERDLLNIGGTFYELPARNAQGVAKIRPVSTHKLAIHDFCSHSGLLFFTGVDSETNSKHIFRNEDGKAAVWAGVVDDLWKLGKPRGNGGPWKDTAVKAGKASDRYLMTGFDKKSFRLSSAEKANIRIEIDIDGTDLWVPYQTYAVGPEADIDHTFPEGFSAYWIRAISDTDTTATFQLEYK